MKIIVYTLTEEAYEEQWRNALTITMDDKKTFHASDGEPEDANLGRDFADCWSIPDMLKAAFEAGERGETLTIENKQVSWEDMP